MSDELQSMDYGSFCENTTINSMIYHCLRLIHADDVPRWVRKFREQNCALEQVMHTLRELVFGVYLVGNGLLVRSEKELGGKTPDWTVISEDESNLAILEVSNFHNTKSTEEMIEANVREGSVFTFWQGSSANSDRFNSAVEKKCLQYRDLVEAQEIPYVVGMFFTFSVVVEPEVIHEVLFGEEWGIFKRFPHLSGILLCSDNVGYRFNYLANPYAKRSLSLNDGTVAYGS